ncbi:MAG: YfiR family protein [Pseudomonadota bacterium]
MHLFAKTSGAFATVAAPLMVLIALLSRDVLGATASAEEIQLAVVYRLAKFVTWPASQAHGGHTGFTLCIDDRNTFEVARRRLQGRSIREQTLRFTLIDPASPLPHCDLLYITERRINRASDLLDQVKGLPVLTVGDSPEFTKYGGIVQLLNRDKRIRMQINVEAARRVELDFSSQLLSLAELVDDQGSRL